MANNYLQFSSILLNVTKEADEALRIGGYERDA